MDHFPSLSVLGIKIQVVSRNCIWEFIKESKLEAYLHIISLTALFNSWTLTIAAVLQIGPDYIFLREAEHAQSPASHAGVNYHPCVCNQSGTLKEASPGTHTKNKSLGGSVTASVHVS